MRKVAALLFSACLVMSMVPMGAMAVSPSVTISSNPLGGTLEKVLPNETMEVNDGTIAANFGTVNSNYGAITCNKEGAIIRKNQGLVQDNYGAINQSNPSQREIVSKIVNNYGTVNGSSSLIENNYGCVEILYAGGILNKNIGVESNVSDPAARQKSVVRSVHAGAKVVENEAGAVVETNRGTVETNNGDISNNFGVVEANNGIVNCNYGGTVNGGKVEHEYVLINGLGGVGLQLSDHELRSYSGLKMIRIPHSQSSYWYEFYAEVGQVSAIEMLPGWGLVFENINPSVSLSEDGKRLVYTFTPSTENKTKPIKVSRTQDVLTGLSDFPTSAIATVPLELCASAQPASASNVAYSWAVVKDGGTESEISMSSGNEGAWTLCAKNPGTVRIEVTATQSHYCGIKATAEFDVVVGPYTAVTGIEGVPTVGWVGGPISLADSKVTPENAVNTEIAWSVSSDDATLEGGILTPKRSGEIVLTATVESGKSYGDDFVQKFSIQVEQIGVLSVEALPAVTVEDGTPWDAAQSKLPSTVVVSLSDDTTANAEISWFEPEGYEDTATVDRTYFVKGSLTVPDGIACEDELREVEVTLTVEAGEQPGDTPGDDPADDPTDNPGGNPSDDPTDNPSDDPADNPSGNPSVGSGEKPSSNSGNKPSSKPSSGSASSPSGVSGVTSGNAAVDRSEAHAERGESSADAREGKEFERESASSTLSGNPQSNDVKSQDDSSEEGGSILIPVAIAVVLFAGAGSAFAVLKKRNRRL